MKQTTKLICIVFLSMTLLVAFLMMLLSVCENDCSNAGFPLFLKLGTSALAVATTFSVHKLFVALRDK